MKPLMLLIIICVFTSCSNNQLPKNGGGDKMNSIQGTWKLISGTLIEKKDTTVTDYTKDKSFIKIIDATHFAFMGHDLNKGKDSATAYYSSGGGEYDLKDSSYTEHLNYCNDRQWEGYAFTFTIHVTDDSLISQGIEKVDSLGISRLNIEKYVRLK